MGAVVTMQGNETVNLRAEFAARITAAWHKSREKIIALGNALIEAKQKLEPGQFTAMIERDLPFGADQARRFMRISADPRLTQCETSHILPETVDAMDTLRRLSDEQFEGAIAAGVVRPGMTVAETRAYVREIRSSEPHRPRHNDIPAPASPAGPQSTSGPANLIARSYDQLVWLLIQRRHACAYSQAELDQIIGWPEGMCSKLEIPHQAEGRTAGPGTLKEWMQGLNCGVQLVAA